LTGPAVGTVNQVLTFDASSSSDPNGDPLTYAWAFSDGGAANGTTTTHAFSAEGGYTITLTVSDTHGASASASQTVTISLAANQLPVALITGPTVGTVGQPLTFSDNGSFDPDGGPLTYTWTFGEGSPVNGPSATHAFSAEGAYAVILTLSDNQGATASASLTVTISLTPNQAPVAVITGPAVGTVNQALTFGADSSSDPDGNPLTYAWSFSEGGTDSGPSTTHTYAATGTYTVTLTVSDNQGGTGSATHTVTISLAPNQPPVALMIGPTAGTVGQMLTFSDDGSYDLNNDPLTYTWSFSEGGTANGPSTPHAYNAAGTYTVTLTVSDTHGASDSAELTVTISLAPNQPPVARLTGPTVGTVGQLLTFSDNGSSDPDNDPLTYAWTFSDGGTASGPSATHAYSAAGTYTVTLTVSDNHGSTSSSSLTVAINAAGDRPVAISETYPFFKNIGTNLSNNQYVIVLKGTGTGALTFRIVQRPAHQFWRFTNMAMNVGTYYRFWDSGTQTWGFPTQATSSSYVDAVTNVVVVQPGNPPTVVYTPNHCLPDPAFTADSFTFTVTDEAGQTSDPATITLNMANPETACEIPVI
jgi:PKD repeat protein